MVVNIEISLRNLIKSIQKSDCIYHFPIDLEQNGQSLYIHFINIDIRTMIIGECSYQNVSRQ